MQWHIYIHVHGESEKIYSNLLMCDYVWEELGNFSYLSPFSIYPSKNIPPIVCVINLLNK